MAGTKTNAGNFFEDFRYGQIIPHATPRTVTDGDVALYTALYGSRFAVQSADTFAKAIGYPRAPLDDLLTFHVVFGKTTPDISLNAIANLGYAACRFLKPVYPGDTLSSVSEVIGLKENSNGETGTVYVRSTGRNQDGLIVLEYCRWVMVRKRDKASPPPEAVVPKLPDRVEPKDLALAIPPLDISKYDFALAGLAASLGRLRGGRKNRPRRRHDAWKKPSIRRRRASTRTRPKCTSISTPNRRDGSASASSTAVSSSRWCGRCPTMASATPSIWPPSTAAGTSPRPSQAIRSMRGRKFSKKLKFQVGKTLARCAFVSSASKIRIARRCR